MQVTLICAACA